MPLERDDSDLAAPYRGEVVTIERRVLGREALLVVAAGLVQIGAPVVIAANEADTATPPFVGLALLAVGVAAIPLRLVRPVAALALAFCSTLAYVSLGYAMGPVWVSLIVTFGNAVLAGQRRAALVAIAAGFVGFPWLGPALGRADRPSAAAVSALAAWLLLLYTACELIRTRRDRSREATRARADTLRRQVADERLAIARELHDVVAHNMSLINLQAGVALHVGGDLPEHAREALTTIKAASKEALVELRSILGVLRHADDGEAAPRAPTPGLLAIDDLAARARAAGVDVTVDVGIDPRELPRSVDTAVYRIVQEALTNVARHAQPPVATVAVHRSRSTLTVSVADAGTGRRPADPLPRGGNGIPGMRERAASVGGTLVAGPRLGAGFTVEAHIPLPDEDDAEGAADTVANGATDTVANGATDTVASGKGTGGSR